MFPLGMLSQDAKIIPILSAATAESSDRTSEVIDTLGYRGLLILVHSGVVHDSAAHVLELEHSDAVTNETTLSSGADVEGTSQALSTTDHTLHYIDGKPTKRYVQLVVNKDAAQTSAQTAVAILYNSKSRPVTHGLGSSTVGEGTAAVAGELNATGWVSGTL
jgi:hypothetical protein